MHNNKISFKANLGYFVKYIAIIQISITHICFKIYVKHSSISIKMYIINFDLLKLSISFEFKIFKYL